MGMQRNDANVQRLLSSLSSVEVRLTSKEFALRTAELSDPSVLPYAVHVFSCMPDAIPEVQHRAALLALRLVRSKNVDVQSASSIFAAVADVVLKSPYKGVQKTAALILAEFALVYSVTAPLEGLLSAAASELGAQEAAWIGLAKVAEGVEGSCAPARWREEVCRTLVGFAVAHSSAGRPVASRRGAVRVGRLLAAADVEGCRPIVLALLGNMALDTDPVIVGDVCKGFLHLVSAGELFSGQEDVLSRFMVHAMSHEDYNVRHAACSFWEVALPNAVGALQESVASLISEVVPLLMCNMQYSLENEHRFYHPDSDEEDTGLSDDDSSSESSECFSVRYDLSVRQEAASSLDSLSREFVREVVTEVLPRVEDGLLSRNSEQQEAATLALGAVLSEKSASLLRPHLPAILRVLVAAFAQTAHRLRSTACWTLGRVAEFAAEDLSDPHLRQLVLGLLFQGAHDERALVRRAGLSAISVYLESAIPMVDHVSEIMESLVPSIALCSGRGFSCAADVLATLVETQAVRTDQVVRLLEALGTRLRALRLGMKKAASIGPVIEAFESCLQKHGSQLFPKCQWVLDNAVELLQEWIQSCNTSKEKQDDIVASIDLLAACAVSLKMDFLKFVTDAFLRQVAAHSCTHSRTAASAIQASGFAFLGDCLANIPTIIAPIEEQALDWVVAVPPKFGGQAVVNNACWSIGQFCQHGTHDVVAARSQKLANYCVQVFQSNNGTETPKTMAGTWARLVMLAPQTVVPLTPPVLDHWLGCMRGPDVDDFVWYKALHVVVLSHATLLRQSPLSLARFVSVSSHVLRNEQVDESLRSDWHCLLAAFRDQDHGLWHQLVAEQQPEVQAVLQERGLGV